MHSPTLLSRSHNQRDSITFLRTSAIFAKFRSGGGGIGDGGCRGGNGCFRFLCCLLRTTITEEVRTSSERGLLTVRDPRLRVPEQQTRQNFQSTILCRRMAINRINRSKSFQNKRGDRVRVKWCAERSTFNFSWRQKEINTRFGKK